MQILLVYAKPVRYTSQKTGEVVTGTEVTGLDVTSKLSGDTGKGFAVWNHFTRDAELYGKLGEVPGLYEAEFADRLFRGKVERQFVGLKYLGPAQVGQAATAGKA